MQKSESRKSATITRRSFFGAIAATGLLTGGAPLRSARAQAQARALLRDLPHLEGDVLFGETERQAIAIDYGGHVSHLPTAVLRPRTVSDVVRIIAFANKHGLRIAMRGGGHSQYGQSQVLDGIVIDSGTLNGVQWHGNSSIDAQPGAQWGDVGKAALARGLIPPVMVDAMMLTVGGTLSVGGTGETGYRYGAQVDNVLELDVVTGGGELLTCSAERNRELFEMTLAGLGQCGIIVRARLLLVRAGNFVARRTLAYDDVETFLSDQVRLIGSEKLGLLNGAAIRADGRSRFEIYAASFVDSSTEADHRPAWLDGLRFASERSTITMPYWDYLDRRRERVTATFAALKRGVRNAALAATLPDNSVKGVLTHILSTPETYTGVWSLEVSAKVLARYTRPLLKTPDADLGYELRVQRRTTGPGSPDTKTLLEATNALLPRVQAAGGKIYPPYCPVLSRQQWLVHYGSAIWQRFAGAKKQFDPNDVLTPGAGIFS